MCLLRDVGGGGMWAVGSRHRGGHLASRALRGSSPGRHQAGTPHSCFFRHSEWPSPARGTAAWGTTAEKQALDLGGCAVRGPKWVARSAAVLPRK